MRVGRGNSPGVAAVAFALIISTAGAAWGVSSPSLPGVACPPVIPTVNDRCPRWASVYDHAGGHARFGVDELVHVALSAAGDRLFAVGHSWDDAHGALGVLTVAYDARTGNELWTARYHGGGSNPELGIRVAASPDGSRVYVAGIHDYATGGDGDLLAMAYDAATGAHLWTTTYEDPAIKQFVTSGAGLSADGSRLYIGGTTMTSTVPDGAVVMSVLTATGERDWVHVHHPQGGLVENIYGFAIGPDDRVYVAGYTRPPSDFLSRDYVVHAFQDDRIHHKAVLDWTATYDGSTAGAIDIANAVAVSPDGGRVVVTGSSERSSGGSADYATIAYEASTGAQEWVTRYGGSTDANYTSGNALAFSPSGTSVFVTGQAGNLVDRHSGYGTVAYDAATGQQQWATVHNGPADYYSIGRKVAVSPDGSRIYVTGEDGRGNVRDTVTIGYDASDGTALWTGRYNEGGGPDWSIGSSLVIAPEGGTVYVGAKTQHKVSVQGQNNQDFVTLAYDA